MKKKVSIVIGLYNSEKTIEAVLKEIKGEFDLHREYDLEVVLVDDYSPDGVYKLVKRIAEKEPWLKVVHLSKNGGQTNAVIEGYRYATGDYVVEMDDDLQMPAKSIFDMIQKLEEGDYDVVFAKYPEQKESLFRRLGSKFNNKMTEIMLDKPRDIRVNSFFVMRRFVRDAMVSYSNNYPYLYGVIFSVTRNVANVEVQHRARTNGKSNYTLRKLMGLWLNGFLNFSVKPLRIAVHLGLAITVISFVIAIILVLQRLITGSTQAMGWTSLMVTIILFAGILLMGIGVLGEYLGRLYLSASGIPRVTVKETINCRKITAEPGETEYRDRDREEKEDE